ncbi:TrmB family transcriptional regulator [Bacillus sp. 165]|uniref:TrmB family transcriptional regulator n=1 Tax=Bacillus sp. 165 TaxID=1529117 RepID=UPI001ADBC081|nr:TrmB family transcriptional regulator [Bacillus sp. 165]MBO9129905.1 TrmB family transcriptional regulator [Bacillus sp. 165]
MLQKFGFSSYESKVYETLVSSDEALDATTIVKHSSVPKAKVYEVLSRMIDKGLIMDTVSEKKKLYAALPMGTVIEKLTKDFQQNIAELKKHESKTTFVDDRVWSLRVRSSIDAQCKSLIEKAEHSIFISAWNDDFAPYISILEEKERQGAVIEGLVIGKVEASLTQLHTLIPSEGHDVLERFKLIIVDEKEVLFAGVENDNWQAMRTMSLPFVKFFTEFFYHDVALTTITGKYLEQLNDDHEIRRLLMRLRY